MLAKALFMSLHQLQVPADKTIKDKVWTQVQDSLGEIRLEAETYRSPWLLYRWWIVAATLLLLGGLVWSIQSTFNDVPLDYEKQVSRAEVSLLEKVNTTKRSKRLCYKMVQRSN